MTNSAPRLITFTSSANMMQGNNLASTKPSPLATSLTLDVNATFLFYLSGIAKCLSAAVAFIYTDTAGCVLVKQMTIEGGLVL